MAPHRATAAEGRPLPPNIRRERECLSPIGYPELVSAAVVDLRTMAHRPRGDLSGIDHLARAASMSRHDAWDEALRYQRRAGVLDTSAYRGLADIYRARADYYFDRAMGG
ncbi:hypothetical protein [Phenylobacterium sp.]|uniref:hypothetical protein n=1 Tax=Phenylobacterium sp. TaxID=1871053 RepID=UPI0035AE9A0D